MYDRRITPGRYLPDSRSACNLGSTTSHCSHSASIVRPSGPGAPLFDATFNSADVSRLTTPSIVTDVSTSALAIASGTPARRAPDRSGTLRRVDPFGPPAVAIGRQSCTVVSSTGPPSLAHERSSTRAHRALP